MSQEKKSAFVSKVEEFASLINKEVANTSNKSVIIIVAESDEDGFGQMVSMAGQGDILVESLARFVTDSEAKEVVHEALKLASLKAIIDKFGDKFDEESEPRKYKL